MMANAPGMAANVSVNIGVPGVYVEPRPTYIRPEYENEWRERRERAEHWREDDRNHGQVVNERAHRRNAQRKWSKHHDKHGH